MEIRPTERPHDGLDAVQSRLRKAKSLHEQFANYFKERAHIEDMYAKNITKAFQRNFITDPQSLGTFASSWEKLNSETVELATLHGQFSLRISNEVEKVLRESTKSTEWQTLLAETNCHRIAKDYDEKQLKVSKYTKTVEKVTGKKAEAAEQKLSEYTQQLDTSRNAWRLEGPATLQKFQTLDQNRLENLKRTVALFESIQTEIALQIAEMSNRTSSSVADFEPILEMELFASEASINLHSIEPHDGASVISQPITTNGDAEARKSNGIHRREMTANSQLSNVSYSTERSAPLSKASLEQPKLVETTEHVRPESNVPGSALDAPTTQVDAEGFTIPPSDQGPWSEAGAGSVYDDERSETSSFFSQGPPKMQMEIRQDSVSESTDEARAALERVTSTLKQTATVKRRHPGRREVRSMYQSEDSFNSLHSSPLSANFTPDSPFSNSPVSRVINTSFSPATSRASTLGIPISSNHTQPQFNHPIPLTPSLHLTNGNGAAVPEVSVVPANILGQSVVAEPEPVSPNGSSVPGSPIRATPINGIIESGVGQKQSWVVSVIERVNVHTQSGEVAKIMVTGDVIMNIEGTEIDPEQPKRAVLRLDQLHALDKYMPNHAFLTAKDGMEGAYVVNLEMLTQAMQQQHGHGHSQGIAVLKYQVKINDDEKKHMMPLLIQPNWKCEPNQTSLLINYKANAHCRLLVGSQEENNGSANSSIYLSELSFLVPVSGEVLSVQSKPTGVWNSESSKMLWDVDNVVMSRTSPEPHKLLARFEMNPSGGLSQVSPTAAKFRVQGKLLSEVNVHLEKEKEEGEETNVSLGQVRLQVQSGRYSAMI
ncbi:hypothetical protein BGZ46_009735 [Entomortierella lignicola]|nr:hypothetical protein BGZ46_009735 [Entomortierella lignicola]